MSYYPPGGGGSGYSRPPPPPAGSQPQYGGQPGYGGPAHSYPPNTHSPYGRPAPPPPAMNQGYAQPGYGPPPTNSPYPPQQQFGAPPPVPQHPGQAPYGHQPYGAPPGPPPGQYGAPQGPPPGQFGAPPGPPPGQYGAPPPQQQQPPYGAPIPYGVGPPAPPSPGYIPNQTAPMDLSREADGLRAAMKRFGTNEKELIRILPPLDPLQVASVRQAYQARHQRNLVQDLEKETSGYFRDGLLAIARGPLDQDCHQLNQALKGIGTKEALLNDVLLSRSNADINAIKMHYQQLFHRSLESDVRGDLSMKTERLFTMVLAGQRAEESTPVIPQQTEADVAELYRATEGQKLGTDQLTVCSVLASRSDGQLRAIAHAYAARYHRGLGDVLRKNFSGHMQDALLFILDAALDRAKHDAELLEATMKGPGTKDVLLVSRVVRLHWDRARLGQAKAAYRHFFRKELAERIKGDTSGDYERLMVACVSIV